MVEVAGARLAAAWVSGRGRPRSYQISARRGGSRSSAGASGEVVVIAVVGQPVWADGTANAVVADRFGERDVAHVLFTVGDAAKDVLCPGGAGWAFS